MATDLNSAFRRAIQKLKDEKRYRVFANLERNAARFPPRCGGRTSEETRRAT